MPFYASADQLHHSFQLLFRRIQEQNPNATKAIQKSRLIIRLDCTAPRTTITLNGRKKPVEAIYGPTTLRPDLSVEMKADILHQIFMGDLSLKKAVAAKHLRVKGPVWKLFVLADIFDQGRQLYPTVSK